MAAASSIASSQLKPVTLHRGNITEENPNATWVNCRGTWGTHLLIVIMLKVVVSAIPGVTNEASWTITNLTYNIMTFFFFHWLLGTPFDAAQGEYASLTLWEQIDHGEQFTRSRKYLTAFPIILFLLSTHYAHYDLPTFVVNLSVLIINVVAKLPAMDRVRILGINKRE